jgi:preprotein translocase subunit SecF
VQDAFKAEADAAIEALKEAFRKENVGYSSIERNDPESIQAAESIQVNVKGVPATQTNDFRRLTNDRVGQQWLLVSENSTDHRLNLRKEAAAKLRQDTLTQSIRTMERKINGLGVAEAAVQQRGGTGGETEILVQLPGVDDPARVKAILHAAGALRSQGWSVPNSRGGSQPEEMRAGKAVAVAVSAGFDRALVTIIDTHVTTVVASAFLFIFGTGPVRGFAVTLVIGLVANLFTAVFVSRAIFDVQIWRKVRMETLSIGRELFRQTSIDFLSRRTLTLGLSALAIVISISSLVVNGGPKQGLDFRGGTLMYVRFEPKPPIDELRQALSAKLQEEISVQESHGTGEFIIGTELADEARLDEARQAVQQTLREKYANLGGKLDLNNATHAALGERLRTAGVSLDEEQLKTVVEHILNYRDREKSGLIGSLEELGRVPGIEPRVLAAIKQECGLGTFNLRSVEIVGPRAGAELRQRAVLATLCALGGMLMYIAFRFQWIAGAAAVIATAHDVIVTLGLFSLTDREINLNIIAALLTLIGYSMNDKIVVFDRLRENLKAKRVRSSYLDLVNQSINQTLSRTLLTAGPTLLACVALYFLGGEVLNGIAFALFVGIIIGTYSSIFVASALLVMWQQYREGRTAAVRRPPAPAPVKSA